MTNATKRLQAVKFALVHLAQGVSLTLNDLFGVGYTSERRYYHKVLSRLVEEGFLERDDEKKTLGIHYKAKDAELVGRLAGDEVTLARWMAGQSREDTLSVLLNVPASTLPPAPAVASVQDPADLADDGDVHEEESVVGQTVSSEGAAGAPSSALALIQQQTLDQILHTLNLLGENVLFVRRGLVGTVVGTASSVSDLTTVRDSVASLVAKVEDLRSVHDLFVDELSYLRGRLDRIAQALCVDQVTQDTKEV